MSSSRNGLRLAFASAVLSIALAAIADAPKASRFGFGKPATPAGIAAWDIDVRPDGKGLPPGRGSVTEGRAVYDAKCASCHGTFGESNAYMAIAGGIGTLASDQPIRTTGSKLNHATTLWDYINRAMPFQSPKTLTADEVYALTAYVLHLNDLLPADAVLDRASLPRVKLPNRDGFSTDHGLARVDGKPDTRNTACMRDCRESPRIVSEIPAHARDAHGDLAEQQRAIGPMAGVRTASAVASADRSDAAAELAKASGCMACHGVGNRVVGPGFREIGSRYHGDDKASERLVARVKNGGAGAWGSVPMPAQGHVEQKDVEAIVRWILAGSP